MMSPPMVLLGILVLLGTCVVIYWLLSDDDSDLGAFQ